MDRIIVFASMILFLGIALCSAQEEITLTTYYPSPYGVYDELRAKKMGIGENWYLSSFLIDDPADLIVEGNVNIATGTGTDTGGILQVGGTLNPVAPMKSSAAIYAYGDLGGILAESNTNYAGRFLGNKGLFATHIVVHPTAVPTVASSIGVYAKGASTGVRGEASDNSNAVGVRGWAASSSTGVNYGVFGQVNSTGANSAGVMGSTASTSGRVYGVFGRSGPANTTNGCAGVNGEAWGSSGIIYGVRGHTRSSSGYGGYFTGGRGVYIEPTISINGNNLPVPTDIIYVSCNNINSVGILSENTAGGYAGGFNGKVNIIGDLEHDHTLHPGWDIAEYIKAEDINIESGDVVVVDPGHDESVVRSSIGYDPTVLGVISTDPSDLGGFSRSSDGKLYTREEMEQAGYRALSLAGRVPCKATTENGPIKRGDLLITSSKPGYAMRADPDKLKPGMILGKALEPLEEGEGKIVVLITLQ